MHQPNVGEREDLRSILTAVAARGTSTGKLFTDLHLMKDRKDFDTLLDGLARAALITLTNDTFRNPEGRDITYRKAAITHEGRTPDDATLDTVWLRTNISAPPSRKKSRPQSSGAPSSPRASSSAKVGSQDAGALNPAAEKLFAQLRSWRTEQARPTKTPAFLILADAVLRTIATHSPQNLTTLHAIPGMGPTKVDRYGAALIALCRGDQPPAPTLTAAPSRTERTDAERPTSAVHPNKRATPPPGLTPTQIALEARLKDWRREAAKAAGLPTFFIFSDTVLRSITVAAPTDLETLRNVRGVAPDKLDSFGASIISLCRD
jgi:ATP-dependent DNA helicase RecQ